MSSAKFPGALAINPGRLLISFFLSCMNFLGLSRISCHQSTKYLSWMFLEVLQVFAISYESSSHFSPSIHCKETGRADIFGGKKQLGLAYKRASKFVLTRVWAHGFTKAPKTIPLNWFHAISILETIRANNSGISLGMRVILLTSMAMRELSFSNASLQKPEPHVA